MEKYEESLVDETVLDLIVVNSDTQTVLERQAITVVYDRWTRCIREYSIRFLPARVKGGVNG
jgi:hypothetical protein